MNEYQSLISPYKWATPQVTFSFMVIPPSYLPASDIHSTTFQTVSAAIKSYVTEVLSGNTSNTYESFFSDVSGLSFSQSSAVGQIDIGSYAAPQGRASGQYPISGLQGGDIWLDDSMTSAPSRGGYNHMAVMHEIGHAVGLEHGGSYPDGGPPPPLPNLPPTMDNRAYSIMSYTPDPNATGGEEPRGLQQLDIAALQVMYGANYTSHADDTTYTFPTNPGIITIWDGGGYDTLDASSFTQAISIDLRPGNFSSIGATNNVAMALVSHLDFVHQQAPLIESASGGSGNDTVIGNDISNVLFSGEGANKLYGLAGNDMLYADGEHDILEGGFGNDWLINSNADGNTQYVFGPGAGHDGVDDSPYFKNSGISIYIRDLDSSKVSLMVERWNANTDPSSSPYYVYDDVFIRLNDTGDTLVLPWTYRPDYAQTDPAFDYSGDTVAFQNGEVWQMSDLESHATFVDYTSFQSLYADDPTLFAYQTPDLFIA